jgi:hypothetical protein
MVRLGARVSLAPDRAPEAYGSPLIRVHDAAGRELRREIRGRELELLDIVPFVELDDGERVATGPGKIRLIVGLGGSAEQLRERVRRMVYDDGDRRPRWLDLMSGLESRGVGADEAGIATLPFVFEFDDEVRALYGGLPG